MELKVGDIVEFKKYEDLSSDGILSIPEDKFPKYGKVTKVAAPVDEVMFFFIEGSTCIFSSKSVARVTCNENHISRKEGSAMKLKVGDIVEFKNYADMNIDDTALIEEDRFPESGKVTEVIELYKDITFFNIEGSPYNFNSGSVARVISDVDGVDINNLNIGDEVLAKVTVKGIFANGIRISSQIKTSDVVKILKRKEPEYFIVKESHYGMYIGTARELVSDKSKAKIYTSENVCNSDAKDMHLDAWEVLPYDD